MNRHRWDNELLSKLLELLDELDVFDVFAAVPLVAEPVGAWPQNDCNRCLHPPGAFRMMNGLQSPPSPQNHVQDLVT